MDKRRATQIHKAFSEAKLDVLVCSLPKNVLLLSGYWPVIGTSVVLAFRDGTVELIVPEDEHELGKPSWADRIYTFKPAPLDKLATASEQLLEPLRGVKGKLRRANVGFEHGEDSEPASYAAMHLYQHS